VRIAIAALPPASDPAEAASCLQRAARDARAAGAGLLVAPARYVPGDPRAGRAEPSDGPFAHAVAEIAARSGLALVVGMVEHAFGQLFDALLVFDAEGHARGHYRRVHLLPGEEKVFAAGAWGTLAPFPFARTGLLVGCDLLVPEFARALVLCGARLLVGADGRSPDVFASLLVARAVENGVPLVWVAREGPAGLALPDGTLRRAAPDGVSVFDVPEDAAAPARPARCPRLYRVLCDDSPS